MTTIPGALVSGVIAHQGGWDEIAMVVVPIAVFGGLLVVVNRRTDRPPADDGDTDADGGGGR